MPHDSAVQDKSRLEERILPVPYCMPVFHSILGIYEAKIKMTAPVTSYVEPGEGPFSQPTITISFYLPREQQSDPPKPVESNVFIEDRPGMTVFVRSFEGVSSAVKNQEELLTLANTLRQDGKVFDEKVFYTAGYDSPLKLPSRLNEVWLVKKNGPPQSQ
ncbi:heme-binding protein 2 isoform X3 [Tachyglossus aculeatus]|uniref:heme-binding protein 2 isoform X3 n=1 Tax=Tachyglossus aculeatus TaxID=9261 RepID=UPI0018F29CC3|nr:heme-binding protein 2 isoform X3 [Tachyglossus aculeatus]